MPKTPPTNCKYCGAPEAERIALNVEFAKGLPFDASLVFACPSCTQRGFEEAAAAILAQVADLPRRRAILTLNLELKQLIARGAPQAEIEANREEKSALVNLKAVGARGLAQAMKRLGKVIA